jgi:hypothetical protein
VLCLDGGTPSKSQPRWQTGGKFAPQWIRRDALERLSAERKCCDGIALHELNAMIRSVAAPSRNESNAARATMFQETRPVGVKRDWIDRFERCSTHISAPVTQPDGRRELCHRLRAMDAH